MVPATATVDTLEMLTKKDVARLLRVTDRHVHNLVQAGRFPAPIKLGTSVRWPRAVILSWLAAQTAEMSKMSE